MRFVIQRVQQADVRVDNETVGAIGKGFLVLIGIAQDDTKEIADRMVKKLCGLRIFDDSAGKTNLSATDVGGRLLIISQFTLCADIKKGNRPSFIYAGKPDEANSLYMIFSEKCAEKISGRVANGVFGASMKVELTNEGPFTILLECKNGEILV